MHFVALSDSIMSAQTLRSVICLLANIASHFSRVLTELDTAQAYASCFLGHVVQARGAGNGLGA